MKAIVVIIISILIICLGFHLDGQFINWALTQFPASAHDWLGVIRIVLWVVTFSTTLTISIFVAYLVGGFVMIAFK